MTSLVDLLTFVVSTLQASRLCTSVAVVREKAFSNEQFVLKVRAQLLNNFPHHFHPKDGAPVSSPLTGDPMADLPIVLANIEKSLSSLVQRSSGRKVLK